MCEDYDTVFSMRNSCSYHDNVVLIHVQDGETPLYIASEKGHGAVVKVLLEQHADVGICRTVCYSTKNIGLPCLIQNGWTPLMTASFKGHADIVQTLIEAKAQVDTQEEV